jgi:hypothetical protein
MRFGAFAGEWRIDRSIEDIRTGRTGTFVGTASFRSGPSGIDYCEHGRLTFGKAPEMTATRRYRWIDAGAGTIEVRFDDGRLFHRFSAHETTPSALHECPPDQYRVRYDFRAWPRWRAKWQVRGPRKAYCITSLYRPAGQAPGITA